MSNRQKLLSLIFVLLAFSLMACSQTETPGELQAAAKKPKKEKVHKKYEDGKELTYELVDGYAMIGDMVLGTEEEFNARVAEYYKKNGKKKKPKKASEGLSTQALERQICTRNHWAWVLWCIPDTYLWPNGVVKYQIQKSNNGFTFSGPQEQAIKQAIAHWEEKTPLRFEAATSGNRVVFRPDPHPKSSTACFAELGYLARVQYIWLPRNCGQGEAVHEIGHTTGLAHEHQRCDRDDHVDIIEENIRPEFLYAFNPICGDRGNDLGHYDYKSVMHYRRNAFTDNGKDTIESLNPNRSIPANNPDKLSYHDALYGVGFRYRSIWPCRVHDFANESCWYRAGTHRMSVVYSYPGSRVKVWIRGDESDYKLRVSKRTSDGTYRLLKNVYSTNGGNTQGYADIYTGDNDFIKFEITKVSGNGRSWDFFYQPY